MPTAKLLTTALAEGRHLRKGSVNVIVPGDSDNFPTWAIVLILSLTIPILCCCINAYCPDDAEEDSTQLSPDDDTRRFIEYDQDNPDTWPFIAMTESVCCYKHHKRRCDECHMDFALMNMLIRDKEYYMDLIFLADNHESQRWSIIQRQVQQYYDTSIASQEHEYSPFLLPFMERMTVEDHVGAIVLAAFWVIRTMLVNHARLLSLH